MSNSNATGDYDPDTVAIRSSSTPDFSPAALTPASMEVFKTAQPTGSQRNGIPHLDQYAGLWAMQESAFLAGLEFAHQINLVEHVAATSVISGEPDPDARYEMSEGGVAVIDIVGTLTKYGSSLSQLPGGTVSVRRAVRLAAADRSVRAILLRIDSPGGMVKGTGDLAEDVARAADRKPVLAYIEDVGASAAYWVASQATRILANPDAVVGSIGIYAVIHDLSAAFEKKGVQAFVIRAGEFKGIGAPGTEITDEQKAEIQRTVNQINDGLVRGVARGRGISEARVRGELADGRVHIGENARQLGLVDGIASVDEALEELRGGLNRNTRPAEWAAEKNEEFMMSQQNTKTEASTPAEPKPATIAELKHEFPESNAEFREGCIEGGLTMTQATKRWADHLAGELKARDETLATKDQELADAKAAAGKPGVPACGVESGDADADAEGGTGDAIERFDAAVRKRMGGGVDRHAAVAAVTQADPELHQAYLLATNPGRMAQRLINEKFE